MQRVGIFLIIYNLFVLGRGGTCHPSVSRDPVKNDWIPAYAGMTSKKTIAIYSGAQAEIYE